MNDFDLSLIFSNIGQRKRSTEPARALAFLYGKKLGKNKNYSIGASGKKNSKQRSKESSKEHYQRLIGKISGRLHRPLQMKWMEHTSLEQ